MWARAAMASTTTPVGVLGGDCAGSVVGWGDFHHVHGDKVDPGNDVPDGAEKLAGGHAAGFRGAGAWRKARVKDVDINGEVDELGAVQGLIDGLVHDNVEATLFEFGHEVPAHPLLFHPLPDLGGGPVAPEADLDEVPGEDGAAFDEPAHGAAVGDQAATEAVGAVSAWESKWIMPTLPRPQASATAVAAGRVIEWSPPRTMGRVLAARASETLL